MTTNLFVASIFAAALDKQEMLLAFKGRGRRARAEASAVIIADFLAILGLGIVAGAFLAIAFTLLRALTTGN